MGSRGGVDFIIAETIEYGEEALIALEVIKKYNLPVFITFAATYPRGKDDYDWTDGCRIRLMSENVLCILYALL